MKKVIKQFLQRIRGEVPLEKLKSRGMKVGEEFWYGNACSFDSSHCWLINIGNNVTFSSRVHLLAHDASTKKGTGYVKIGLIDIGNNVFIGAGTTIMPNVSIGNDAIIGAGSIVTKTVPAGEVWAGVPAKYICKCEELNRRYIDERIPIFDESYTIRRGIDAKKKKKMIEILRQKGIGLVK